MALWIFAAVLSAFIKGLSGIGDAPVFTSVLAFAYDNIEITPIALMMSLPSNLYLAWKNRRSLNPRIWLPMSALIVAGSIPGILFLKNMDTHILKLIFGLFIAAVGAILLKNEVSPQKREPSKIMLTVIGILAGITSGLFGIGVLMAVYVIQTADDVEEFKANICMVFASENLIRLILYIFMGIIGTGHLKRAAILYPFLLAGLFCGMKSASFLDERKVKIIMMITLIFSGIAIFFTSL